MADEIKFFELNTGAKIPSIGLGTWQAEPGLVGSAVVAAIKAGYRHIDFAQGYFNEKEVGLALKSVFEDGVVKREDLFITSKLWCTDHAAEDVPEALHRTLGDLQLMLIFTLYGLRVQLLDFLRFFQSNISYNRTSTGVCELYDARKARAIGVSNFSSKKLADLLDVAHVPPAANQVECHPSWQQGKLRAFCTSKGVHLSGYSPLGSPGTSSLKSDVLKHPDLQMVAEKLGKSPAQIAL